jgi:alkyl hydroperoxide reductase subunit AhpF
LKILTKIQQDQARQVLANLDDPVELTLFTSEQEATSEQEDDLAARLWLMAQDLADLSDKIQARQSPGPVARTALSVAGSVLGDMQEGKEEFPSTRTVLSVAGKERHGVFYAALPDALEWMPFLQTLQRAGSDEPLVEEEEEVEKSSLVSRRLEVYITPHCPFCGQVVEEVNRLTLHLESLQCWIIDAERFEREASEAGIRSAPTLFLDGAMAWVGALSQKQLLDLLRSSAHWESLLRSQLHSGSVEDVVALVRQHPASAPALGSLLALPEMSLRMGVLRVIEEIAAEQANVARDLVEILCPLLQHEDPNIRGDAAYGLGLLGEPAARPALLAARQDPHPDVEDAIEEALETLPSD